MKHNLETIKGKLDAHFQNQNVQSFDVLQEEINGFEKELRERLRYCQASKFLWNQKADFIREILGEDQK